MQRYISALFFLLSFAMLSANEGYDTESLLEDPEDVVILHNGVKIYGEIAEIPSLYFPTGRTSFDPNAVAAIVFYEDGWKADYLTQQGDAFSGRIKQPENKLSIEVFDGERTKIKYLSPKDVRAIIIRENHVQPVALKNQRIYTVVFEDQTRLPFVWQTDQVVWKENQERRRFNPNQILNVFKGNHFRVELATPGKKSLELIGQPEDAFVEVSRPDSDELIQLHWNDVSKIRLSQSFDTQQMFTVLSEAVRGKLVEPIASEFDFPRVELDRASHLSGGWLRDQNAHRLAGKSHPKKEVPRLFQAELAHLDAPVDDVYEELFSELGGIVHLKHRTTSSHEQEADYYAVTQDDEGWEPVQNFLAYLEDLKQTSEMQTIAMVETFEESKEEVKVSPQISKKADKKSEYVTVREYREFLEQHGIKEKGAIEKQDVEAWDRPMTGLTYDEVEAFAQWKGMRLPRFDEISIHSFLQEDGVKEEWTGMLGSEEDNTVFVVDENGESREVSQDERSSARAFRLIK